MSKRLLGATSIIALSFVVIAPAQTSQTTTTTTTQTTRSTQNADGTWTVVEYPADKEVVVDLSPTTMVPGAKGRARVMRRGSETTINLEASGLGDGSSYNLYAVDPTGRTTMLGPVTVNNGVGTFTTSTPLDKFMLVVSPETNLTTMSPDAKVFMRSSVPTGMAVVPVSQSGPQAGAPIGERVSAVTTASTPSYNVPMLNIPGFRQGTDSQVKVNFGGELRGVRANTFIKPRKDGATQIKMRFHELKRAVENTRLVLWTVSPDNKFTPIGQVINTGRRNEGKIDTETALKDFGLLVTVENTETPGAPSGQPAATFTVVP